MDFKKLTVSTGPHSNCRRGFAAFSVTRNDFVAARSFMTACDHGEYHGKHALQPFCGEYRNSILRFIFPMTKQESRIDWFLDGIRETNLPVAVELPLLILSSFSTGMLYTFIYHILCKRTTKQQLPIMVPCQNDAANELSFDELYQKIREKLEEQSLLKGHENDDDEEALVQHLLKDDPLRRFVSAFLTKQYNNIDNPYSELYKTLHRIRPRLLQLPPLPPPKNYPFQVSLILPAYKETNHQVASTLLHAFETAENQEHIQVIVVNAGYCSPDLDVYLIQHTPWETLQVVTSPEDAGRGPALNAGASYAEGRILVFLHADIKTPYHWDRHVLNRFDRGNSNSHQRRRVVHATCFRFRFDFHSLQYALAISDTKAQIARPHPSPWVLLPIQWMVNLRTYALRLAYGDQMLSLPAAYFHHIGGFPNQSMMEDYSLVDYLRQRARCLPEQLAVLPYSCQVSTRRWQRVGALYMTLTNALFVFRYTCLGWSADDIFDHYYRRTFETTESNGHTRAQ